MHIDVALDVDEAMVKGIHLRDEERQRTEVGLFGGEELDVVLDSILRSLSRREVAHRA